jgi:hypothetical protein
VVEEDDLQAVLDEGNDEMLPLPAGWDVQPRINWVRSIHRARSGR